MSDLTDFLLARIAEDEYATRAKVAREHAKVLAERQALGEAFLIVASGRDPFSPARVLAECEAKRRIVERHTAPSRDGQYDPECTEDGYGLASPNDCPTLRILAAVYADHPDYRQEWATSASAPSDDG